MKIMCIMYLLLGSLISYVLYQLTAIMPVEFLVHHFDLDTQLYKIVAFAVILPISFFIGSMITGYCCQPHITHARSFIFVSPGIYMTLVTIPTQTTDAEVFLKTFLTFGVIWILFSIGGVYAGRYWKLGKGRTV